MKTISEPELIELPKFPESKEILSILKIHRIPVQDNCRIFVPKAQK
jgi:hypothetical protein